MSLSGLIGNEKIKRWLRNSLSANRLPGTLIFFGPEGVGKKRFALELAKTLNCTHTNQDFDACDSCAVCRRIEAGQYADTKLIAPDGQFIKVDQARQVIDEAYYRPFEGKKRVFIFDEAERLREQAANALLKTLEEPPATTLLILITTSMEALLPTIRSRSLKLPFTTIDEADLLNYLTTNHPRPASEQKLIVKLAAGSIGNALKLDLSLFYEQRKECLELLDLLLQRRHKLRLLKQAEYFGRKERANFEELASLITTLIHDINCVRLDLDSSVINCDIIPHLQGLSQNIAFSTLARFNDQLARLRREMIRNLNRHMALEAIFLDVASAT